MAACTPSIHVFLGPPLFLLSREKLLVSHRAPPHVGIGERSADMVGTGEIKYPGWPKTSSAGRQFDIDLSRARGENLHQKSTPNLVLQFGG